MGLWGIRDYRHLFAAQVIALFGTGLATVALALLAYDLAGADAAAVLGTALAIKMVAYVVVAPVAAAFVDRVPRRTALVTLDLVRAAVVVALPFVEAVWQVYLLVAVLQCASAAFTPTFQAMIPDVVTADADYTRALSASQLASTMESLLSPVLAAAALSVMGFHWLFLGTVVGFLASAALVVTTAIPDARPNPRLGVWNRTSSGVRIMLATPRLRGVLGLDLAVAGCGAIVMVTTVNLVRDGLGRPQADVAWLLAASGAGTMAAAVLLPRVLRRLPERPVMLAGVTALVGGGLFATAAAVGNALSWTGALAAWAVIGAGTGAVLTPVGRVLRRSAAPEDLPAVFAAQFSLSHLCWLIAYPIAGWGTTLFGFAPAWTVLVSLSAIGAGVAALAWPRRDPARLPHVHRAEATSPEHLRGAVEIGGGVFRHVHDYVIDAEHARWPSATR